MTDTDELMLRLLLFYFIFFSFIYSFLFNLKDCDVKGGDVMYGNYVWRYRWHHRISLVVRLFSYCLLTNQNKPRGCC